MANWRGDAVEIPIANDAPAANTHTGDTLQTTMQAVTIIGGTVEAGDTIKVHALWESDSGVNADKFTMHMGGTAGGNEFYNTGAAASLSNSAEIIIFIDSNTTMVTSQRFGGLGVGVQTVAPRVVTGLDWTADVALNIGCLLANSADTVTLHGYVVSIVKKRT